MIQITSLPVFKLAPIQYLALRYLPHKGEEMSHDNPQPSEFDPEEKDSDQVEQWPGDSADQNSRSEPLRKGRMGSDRRVDKPGNAGVQPENAIEGEIYDEVQRGVEHGVEQALVQMVSHSGPLPPASEFAAYEAVLSGAADRILAMAEKSSEAAAEATSADAAATRAAASSILEDGAAVKRGQYIYACITIVCLVLAVILVIFGHPIPAAVSGVAGIVSGFGVLITPVNKDRWRPQLLQSPSEE